MNAERSYTPNVFQIYKQVGSVPFAVARKSWHGDYVAIVTKVLPKGDYGTAYGFLSRMAFQMIFFLLIQSGAMKW